MQTGDHVRMDLFYSNWSLRRRSAIDLITAVVLISYLGFMLFGGLSSTAYAIQYGEKSFTAWAPYMWPIKVIMTFGILLMLLQSIANLIKDVAQVRGKPIA
jgi:TRAP-type mannitol/chloroaromatic compound transport system permease small subunit